MYGESPRQSKLLRTRGSAADEKMIWAMMGSTMTPSTSGMKSWMTSGSTVALVRACWLVLASTDGSWEDSNTIAESEGLGKGEGVDGTAASMG